MKRILFVGALVLVLAGPAAAQQVLKNGTISTSGADCSTATACVVLEERQLQGVEQVGIYVNVGTSGTFHFEAEGEDGVWFAIANTAGNSSVTADGNYYIVNQGVQRIRVRASAISGNATVTMSRGFVAAAAGGGGDATLSEQEAQTIHLAAIEAATEAAQTVLEGLSRSEDETNDVSFSTASTQEIIPLAASEVIHGKGLLVANGTTTVTIVYGTGASCGTGQVTIGTADLTLAEKPYFPFAFHVPAGNALCVINSAAVAVKGQVEFTQYVP
jgi:hypothetical protein